MKSLKLRIWKLHKCIDQNACHIKNIPYPKSTLMLQVALDKVIHFNFQSDNVMNQRYHMINKMMAIAYRLVNMKTLYTGNMIHTAHCIERLIKNPE